MAAGGINGEIIKRFVRERIDSINISTLIKLSGDGILPANISDYFLEGGEVLDKDRFLMLAISKDTRVLLEGLANAVKDSRWKDAIISLESENIFFLEEQIEELTRQNLCRLAIIEPLSIALAICFIYTKIREIKNLRVIVRAKIFNMPVIEMKRFLILG